MADDKPIASLADFTAIIEQLSGKKLSDLLKGQALAASCTNLCDCHGRYCACHGSVSKIVKDDALVLPADFLELRDIHIKELKDRLKALETPLK